VLGGGGHGALPTDDQPWRYIEKSMSAWVGKAKLAGVAVAASIGNDFSNGHRGMARSVRGAKKYVHSRTRFHDNAAARKLARKAGDDEC
jgi:hypothetical protein